MQVSKLTLSNDLRHQRSTAATVLLWIQKHPKMSQQTTVNAIAGQVAILNPLVPIEDAKEAMNWMKKVGLLKWTSNGPRSSFEINYRHKLIPKEVLAGRPTMTIPVEQPEVEPQPVPVKVKETPVQDEIPVRTEVPVMVNGASFTISLEIKVSIKTDEATNIKEISIKKG